MTMEEYHAEHARFMAERRAEEARMKAAGFERYWDVYKRIYAYRPVTREMLAKRLAAIERRLALLAGPLPEPSAQYVGRGTSEHLVEYEDWGAVEAAVDYEIGRLINRKLELRAQLEAK